MLPLHTTPERDREKDEYRNSVYDELRKIIINEPETLDDWISVSDQLKSTTLYEKLSNCFVTENATTEEDQKKIIFLANAIDGPKIIKTDNKGYGLFADKDYTKINLKIRYEGKKVYGDEAIGDYIVWYDDEKFGLDGTYNYSVRAKGRWINDTINEEEDNMLVGEYRKFCFVLEPVRNIKKGEELLLYYGDEYDRPWLNIEYSFYI